MLLIICVHHLFSESQFLTINKKCVRYWWRERETLEYKFVAILNMFWEEQFDPNMFLKYFFLLQFLSQILVLCICFEFDRVLNPNDTELYSSASRTLIVTRSFESRTTSVNLWPFWWEAPFWWDEPFWWDPPFWYLVMSPSLSARCIVRDAIDWYDVAPSTFDVFKRVG